MSSFLKYARVASIAGAVLAAGCLISFLALPTYLSGDLLAVKRVRANFKTPEEMKTKSAQALLLDEPVFGVLYEKLGDEKVDVYLAPRNTLAYTITGLLTRFLKVEKPAASREDLLAAPPAPEAMVYLDETNVYALQAKGAQVFIRWLQIGAGVALAACVAAFLVARKVSGRGG